MQRAAQRYSAVLWPHNGRDDHAMQENQPQLTLGDLDNACALLDSKTKTIREYVKCVCVCVSPPPTHTQTSHSMACVLNSFQRTRAACS